MVCTPWPLRRHQLFSEALATAMFYRYIGTILGYSLENPFVWTSNHDDLLNWMVYVYYHHGSLFPFTPRFFSGSHGTTQAPSVFYGTSSTYSCGRSFSRTYWTPLWIRQSCPVNSPLENMFSLYVLEYVVILSGSIYHANPLTSCSTRFTSCLALIQRNTGLLKVPV